MKATPRRMIRHCERAADTMLRSSTPAWGSVVRPAATRTTTVASAAAPAIPRKVSRQSPTSKTAPTTRGAATAASCADIPWTPMARPTRSGNSSLTSGFAATKYIPLDSPIRNAPAVRWATDGEREVNDAVRTRSPPVPAMTR
jgi:hypothetical protein